MADVVIKIKKNGPLIVDGPVRLVDSEGNEYPGLAGRKLALCRCGASVTKPFCDGTHSRLGFAAAERAVRAAEGES
jgi:CDGSH-type Zn-finger protein